jgi:uncharacterized protein with HEPN domain
MEKVTRNAISWRNMIRMRSRIHAYIENRKANVLANGRI